MISVQIYDETANQIRGIDIDFINEVLSTSTVNTPTMQYFFKMTTGAVDTSSINYQPRVVRLMSDLALNKTKRSSTNSNTAYADITTMVQDYVYDYIYGHTANQFSSGCTVKAPMKFT